MVDADRNRGREGRNGDRKEERVRREDRQTGEATRQGCTQRLWEKAWYPQVK